MQFSYLYYSTSFGDGVGFHEFGSEFFGAGEVVDINFEEMLEGFVGDIVLCGLFFI